MRIRKRRESLYHWRFPDLQILPKKPEIDHLSCGPSRLRRLVPSRIRPSRSLDRTIHLALMGQPGHVSSFGMLLDLPKELSCFREEVYGYQLGGHAHGRIVCSTTQSTIVLITTGAIVSSIREYSERAPVLQVWNR
jgi:hypothetical protein